ncbi:hypothetical protein FRB94_011039 [Tulasnella sp. JGI-2019a]|nr:hypothetical protein FRB94_011039 [Tulasnella sp. JGI-2019a]KAG9029276.1 hypothetical protein FRB95_005498 [Tulasnella sp. JGI-2019a]
MRLALIAAAISIIFIAEGLAVLVHVSNNVPSLQTLALGTLNNEAAANLMEYMVAGDAIEAVLEELLHGRSDPAKMARRARVMFSHSDSGVPIRAYLKQYGPDGSMAEWKSWLNKDLSPPAIYMLEKYSGMKPEELHRPGSIRPDRWKLSYIWVQVLMTFDPAARKAIVTCVLGMTLDSTQLNRMLGYHFLFDFPNGLDDPLHSRIMAPNPVDRLEAFERLEERRGKNEQNRRPQESIIYSVIGAFGTSIG